MVGGDGMEPWVPLGKSQRRLLRFKTKARTYSAVNNSFEKQLLVGHSALTETECLMIGGNPEIYEYLVTIMSFRKAVLLTGNS